MTGELTRLFQKGIVADDGYVGTQFYEARFFRAPMVRKDSGLGLQREFLLRILRFEDHALLLNQRKCDDLFVLGSDDVAPIELVDINVETFSGVSFREFKYMLGVSNAYE